VIEVKAIRKAFGDVVALRSVSFSAENGHITGLLGPNGAGKTTLLRILYTILSPDGGTATIDGRDVTGDPTAVGKLIGALPHAHGLYGRLTAREHVRYYGNLHGLRGPALEARIDVLIDLLDMGDIADRRTAGFSQGQSVKVAVARSMVHDPPNVLFDEPTAGLDVMSTRKMRAFIRQLRDQGRCVLFSSHLMHEVSELCDEIVVVARGEIVASGSPDDLRQQTGCDDLEDAFVAAIGTDEGLLR
jgi:sodium transport system ATP-binding protein